MTPPTANALARTHAAAFPGHGWDAEAFARYLNDPRIHIFGDATSFSVIRVLGPEAEILTLATHPDAQGRGLASALLQGAMSSLEAQGVEDIFLDVKDTNTPAIALYRRAGFAIFSKRAQYYGDGASALCMKAELSAASDALSTGSAQ